MENPKCLNATNFFNSPECVESADTIGTFPESAPSVRGRVKKSKFPLKNVNFASFKYRHTSTNINPMARATNRRLVKPN